MIERPFPDAPSGWRTAALGDALSTIDAGVSPQALDRPAMPGELGVLKVSAVTWSEFRPHENKALPDGFDASERPRVRRGDLLLSRANTRELVAAPVIAPDEFPNLLLSDKTLRLVPKPGVAHAPYLLYALRTRAVRRYFESHATGTSGSMRNVSQETIRGCPIPLPPIEEQRRIAEVLDRAEALRAKRRAALAQLDTLTQAIFLDLFGDPAANPRQWGREKLRNLVVEFRYGTSAKSQTTGKATLRIPNVVGGVIDLSELKMVPVDDDEFERLRLRDGDLLFVRTNGNPDFVGRCAMFDASDVSEQGIASDEVIYASYLIRARPILSRILPIFLREFLLGAEGRRALRSRCKTSAGQYNLNTEGLGGIDIPLPPLGLQQELSRRVAAVEKLKAAQRASLAEMDALFASLQHRAFRGEL